MRIAILHTRGETPAAEAIGAWLAANMRPAPEVVLTRGSRPDTGLRLDAIIALVPPSAAEDGLVEAKLWQLADSRMRIVALGGSPAALERASGWRVPFHAVFQLPPEAEPDADTMRALVTAIGGGGHEAAASVPVPRAPRSAASPPSNDDLDIPTFLRRMEEEDRAAESPPNAAPPGNAPPDDSPRDPEELLRRLTRALPARSAPEPGDELEIPKFLRRQGDASTALPSASPTASPADRAAARVPAEPSGGQDTASALLDERRRTVVDAARPPRAPSSVDRSRVLASAARQAALERRAPEESADAAMRLRRKMAEREMSSSRQAAPPGPPAPRPQAAPRAAQSTPGRDRPEPGTRADAPPPVEYSLQPALARSARRKLSRSLLLGAAAIGGLAVLGITTDLVDRLLATLAGYLGVTPVMPSARPAEPEIVDDVDLSLFSRPSASRGSQMLVQALLHVAEAIDVAPMALMADPAARLKARRSLLLPLARGDRVDLVVAAPGCGIEAPRETIVWRRQTTSAGFLIDVPADYEGEAVHVTVNAFHNGEPLGRITFAAPLAGAAEPQMRVMGDEARRFSHAFVSYASADRPVVIRYAHAWSVMRQSYFQDFLSLQPGDAWRTRLVEEIDRSDVLVLFWSQAASRSDHVRREVEYALERRKAGHAIEILPVIIDGPPPAQPPDSLSSIHFNDRHAYIVASVMAEAAQRPA